jgi:protein SCO1
MQKIRKAGLLIVLLVVPAFIFIFLKLFGTNHFELPTYHPVLDAVSGKALLMDGDTVYYAVAGLSLSTLSDGLNQTEQVLTNKFSVVGYLPATCTDTCQRMVTQLKRIQELHETIAQVQILTLQPKPADTGGSPASNPDDLPTTTDSWKVLTGTQQQINDAMHRVFRLDAEVTMGRQTILPDKRLILVDGQRRIRGYYHALDPEDINRLMAEIKVLEYSKSLDK